MSSYFIDFSVWDRLKVEMKEYITFSLHLQVHTTEYLFFDSACASQSICTFIGLAFIPVPRNDKLIEYRIQYVLYIILYCTVYSTVYTGDICIFVGGFRLQDRLKECR